MAETEITIQEIITTVITTKGIQLIQIIKKEAVETETATTRIGSTDPTVPTAESAQTETICVTVTTKAHR